MTQTEYAYETDVLAALVQRKHDVLAQMHALSRLQERLTGEGEMEKLLQVLAAKQTLLGALQETDRALDPFRAEDPEARRWRSAEHRALTSRLAQASERMLREIMLLERTSESDLRQRRDELSARLDVAHSAVEVRQAYAAIAPQVNQLDLSSER